MPKNLKHARPQLISLALLFPLAVGLGSCTGTDKGPDASASPSVVVSATPDNTITDPAIYAQEIFALTNVEREKAGLEQFTWNDCAATQATDRASALLGIAELTHAPLAPVAQACSYGINAENLVDAAVTPEHVLASWLKSPGHAANILDPTLSLLGVGCVTNGEEEGHPKMLCSQIFMGVLE